MKTIHVLIAATALACAPIAVRAQSANPPTQEPTEATDASGAPETTTESAARVVEPVEGNVGSSGSGTSDVGNSGTGTGASDVGNSGSGTGTNDIGNTGTGTGTNSVGSSGSGTGTNVVQSTSPATPAIKLAAKSTSLRTPGSMQVFVTLASATDLDPARAATFSVPLASSSASCRVPASVDVAWTSTDGGLASVMVDCEKSGAQTVSISSGDASTSFTTR